jgi:protein PsiE
MSKLFDVFEEVILAAIVFATLFAVGEEVYRLILAQTVALTDLLLLFIYAEVVGMVAIFYRSHRIPATLPIIIATTALSRMIILQSKEFDPSIILYEAGGIVLLSIAAFIMTYRNRYVSEDEL